MKRQKVWERRVSASRMDRLAWWFLLATIGGGLIIFAATMAFATWAGINGTY